MSLKAYIIILHSSNTGIFEFLPNLVPFNSCLMCYKISFFNNIVDCGVLSTLKHITQYGGQSIVY